MGSELILVAGIDYPKYKTAKRSKWIWEYHPPQCGSWRQFCELIAKRSLKQDPKLLVTLFDFYKGTRETLTLTRGRLNSIPASDVTFGKPNFKNYRVVNEAPGHEWFLIPEPELRTEKRTDSPPAVRYVTGVEEIGQGEAVDSKDYKAAFYDLKRSPEEKSISITDVYDYVRHVGLTRSKTVKEFHLFSHGYAGGPILLNTQDYYRDYMSLKDPSLKFVRDPLDKDGRASKDFRVGDMHASEPTKAFAEAFAAGATSYVWGCVAWHFMKMLVGETIRQMKTVTNTKEKKLQFTWSKDWGVEEGVFHDSDHLRGSAANHRSDWMSIDDVVTFVKKLLNWTYMHQLAVASNNRVIGSLPGTYSDYDTGDDDSKKFERLLHIPMGATFGDDLNFQGTLEFYQKKLHINFERKGEYSPKYGRGYAIYPVAGFT